MCAVYASFIRVQQTRLDVHRTLARVPTVRQNTADDNANDTLGNGHRSDVRRPMLRGRVPSKQATHALRTKTGEFKMESQRQESQTMNHLKSRTKPPDTRSNLSHWCKSMTRTENHVPLIIANTTTGHATRPPDPNRHCRPMTKTRNHAP